MALVDIAGKVKPWSQYMQPTQQIDPGASRVNNLTIRDDKLCYNGAECSNVVSAERGIIHFITHIKKYYPDGVLLIAHNGDKFDFPLLQRDLKKYGSDLKMKYRVAGLDSLNVFRRMYPGLRAYNQPYLVERFLENENVGAAHEAVGDCSNLKRVIETAAAEKKMSISEFLQIPGLRTTNLV